MCISCFAAYLNPFHPVGKIRFFHHQALVYRLGETRPSATRIKLIGRDKQRFPSRDIYVDAFTLFIPIFILESSFRSVLLRYREAVSNRSLRWPFLCLQKKSGKL